MSDNGKDKTVEIIVDGTAYKVPKKDHISYAEVVTLADPQYPQHPEVNYTVTYERGHGKDGILAPGGSVKIKDEMVFHVDRTGQS